MINKQNNYEVKRYDKMNDNFSTFSKYYFSKKNIYKIINDGENHKTTKYMRNYSTGNNVVLEKNKHLSNRPNTGE